jgi:S-formylglutathione hydrolase FrmB
VRRLLLLSALLAGILLPATAPARADDVDASGIELVAVEQLSPRLETLWVRSDALARTVAVRVLRPSDDAPVDGPLPVLWLLHGGFGSSADWTNAGGAEALTDGLPMLVVMPDAGTGGWYTDWVRGTQEGPQRWETFHIDELRPFIEARYGTRTDRDGRAVAGLSMGGFGAISYAARHPDLFSFAASFSGAVDILHPGVSGVVTISPLAHQGVPGDVFGHRILEEATWRAHNPVDLAASLRDVTVELRTGNGMPGGPHGGGWDIQEIGVSQANATLHQALVELGIDHVYDDYGPGAHSWPYWHDALARSLPGILARFAEA